MSSSAQQFWDWFSSNNKAYLFLNEVDEKVKEQLLDDLLMQLHQYCSQLYFEIGGHAEGDQELIITAEGNTSYFEQVEALIAAAPKIEGWNFIAFIQPAGADLEIDYEEVVLQTGDLWFHPLAHPENPASIGIKVCLKNYELVKDNQWLQAAVYKALDAVLGEKSLALDITYVEIGQLPDDPEEEAMIEFRELPAYVTWKKAKLKK
jgi:hypothetical protein